MSSYKINKINYGETRWEYMNVPEFDQPSGHTIYTGSTGWAEFQNAFKHYLVYGINTFDINIKEKQFKLLKIL